MGRVNDDGNETYTIELTDEEADRLREVADECEATPDEVLAMCYKPVVSSDGTELCEEDITDYIYAAKARPTPALSSLIERVSHLLGNPVLSASIEDEEVIANAGGLNLKTKRTIDGEGCYVSLLSALNGLLEDAGLDKIQIVVDDYQKPIGVDKEIGVE